MPSPQSGIFWHHLSSCTPCRDGWDSCPTSSGKSCFLSFHQRCRFQECSFHSKFLAHSSPCFLGTHPAAIGARRGLGKQRLSWDWEVVTLAFSLSVGEDPITLLGWVFVDDTQPWAQGGGGIVKISLVVSWDDVPVVGYKLVGLLYPTH